MSVADLIAQGKVPADTSSASNHAVYQDGWPIFTNLRDQVKYDWDHLPTERTRILKANTEYKAALEAYLLEGAPVTDGTGLPGPETTLGPSIEEQIEGASNEPASTQIEGEGDQIADVGAQQDAQVTPSAPATPTASTEEQLPDGWVKTADGYEFSIVGAGGTQVFRGRTILELAAKLGRAQVNATELIRKQKQEKDQILASEPADPAVEKKILKPRKMTAEEQFEFAEAIASGDPIRINKAMTKRDQITLGGDPEEVIAQVTEHQNKLEIESYKATAKMFMKDNPDVVFTKELGDAIDEVLLGNNWAYTVRNLNKVLAQLKSEGKVTLKVSTPEEDEVVLPTPTSAQRQPQSTPPAPQAPAAPAAAAAPAVPKAPVITDGDRLRPGSASTGLSPRQASVRPGAASTKAVKTVGLTAEEYNRMSVSETRRKYATDLGFRAAVDQLIKEGKI